MTAMSRFVSAELSKSERPELTAARAQRIEEASQPNLALVNAVVRAHAWVKMLQSRQYASIEEMAKSIKLNPNVVRQNIRVAFIDPHLTEAVGAPGHGARGRESTVFHRPDQGHRWKRLLACKDWSYLDVTTRRSLSQGAAPWPT